MGKLVKICNVHDLQENKAARFLIEDDIEIVAYKIEGKFYAAANTCPHNHSHQMHEGYVDNDLYITCPVHGYKFHLETGEVPPNSTEMSGKLEIFQTKVENGELYVEKKESMFKFWKW